MEIEMGKKYAFRHKPKAEVKVLTTTRNSERYTMVSMDKSGLIKFHQDNGQYLRSGKSEYDLVPLYEELYCAYNLNTRSTFGLAYNDKQKAKKYVDSLESHMSKFCLAKLEIIHEDS